MNYICPLCKGSGRIVSHRKLYTAEQRKEARELYAKGFTLRAIGKKLGINHPQKIYSLIMAKTL